MDFHISCSTFVSEPCDGGRLSELCGEMSLSELRDSSRLREPCDEGRLSEPCDEGRLSELRDSGRLRLAFRKDIAGPASPFEDLLELLDKADDEDERRPPSAPRDSPAELPVNAPKVAVLRPTFPS